jgi:hypothetical protein
MTIEKLKRIVVEESEDGTQTTKLPSNLDMMNKINEIIDVINILDMKLIAVGVKVEKQERREVHRDIFKPRNK